MCNSVSDLHDHRIFNCTLLSSSRLHKIESSQSKFHQAEPSYYVAAAFDALLVIPGLWGGFILTTLHKMIAMKCDEVSVRCPKEYNFFLIYHS